MAGAIEATGWMGSTFTLATGEARPVENRGLGPLEAREVIVLSGLVSVPLLLTFQQVSGASDRTGWPLWTAEVWFLQESDLPPGLPWAVERRRPSISKRIALSKGGSEAGRRDGTATLRGQITRSHGVAGCPCRRGADSSVLQQPANRRGSLLLSISPG